MHAQKVDEQAAPARGEVARDGTGGDAHRPGEPLPRDRARPEAPRGVAAEDDRLDGLGALRLRRSDGGGRAPGGQGGRRGPPRLDLPRVGQVARGVGPRDERVVAGARRERAHRQPQGLERRARARRARARGAERRDRERQLLGLSQVEQERDLAVDEAEQEARWQRGGPGEGQEVGQDRAGVPEEVAVPAVAVLPGRAPGDPGQHEGGGARRQRRVGGGARERAAVVAGSQPPERELERPEVVHPRRQAVEVAADDVGLDRVEGSRGGGGAQQEGLRVRAQQAGDPGGEEEEAGEPGEVEVGRSLWRSTRERLDRREPALGEVRRQRERRDGRIVLEGQGLVGPVEILPSSPHALVAVLRAIVVLARGGRRAHRSPAYVAARPSTRRRALATQDPTPRPRRRPSKLALGDAFIAPPEWEQGGNETGRDDPRRERPGRAETPLLKR